MLYGTAYLSHPYGGDEGNREDSILLEEGINALQSGEFWLANPLHEECFARAFKDCNEDEDMMLNFCEGYLSGCKLIIMCPGWENSRGCKHELAVAKRCGIPRIYLTKHEAALFREFAIQKRIKDSVKEVAA